MADGAGAKAPPNDPKAENKRLTVQFKAQHALMVGFFTLIAYVGLGHRYSPSRLTGLPASSTRLESTSSALASSSPVSSSKTALNAPFLLSNFKMDLCLVMWTRAVGTRRASIRPS